MAIFDRSIQRFRSNALYSTQMSTEEKAPLKSICLTVSNSSVLELQALSPSARLLLAWRGMDDYLGKFLYRRGHQVCSGIPTCTLVSL